MSLTTNLLAYYDLDDNSGTSVRDKTGNAHTGTATSTWTTGKLGQSSGNFSGSTLIDCGNAADIQLARTSTWTISCWIKSTQATLGRMVSKIGTNPFPGYSLMMGAQTAGHITIQIVNNSSTHLVQATGNTDCHDGNWHHVVWTYDGSGVVAGCNIYVDNVLQSLSSTTDNLGANPISTSADLGIGAISGTANTQNFNGQIDEVGIWSRVLALSEIATLYNNGAGMSPYPTTETWWNAQTFNWTCPPNVWQVIAECWGAGGGGGGANGNSGVTSGGGGGGGGAYASALVSVIPGNTYQVLVGTGGTGYQSGGTNATSGTASKFNSTSVIADFGRLGASPTTGGAAGTAGASTGTTTTSGSAGTNASASHGGAGGNSANPGQGTGGAGGASALQAGNSGGKPGAGGGGTGKGDGTPSDDPNGGNGADGQVQLTYYPYLTPPLVVFPNNPLQAVRRASSY